MVNDSEVKSPKSAVVTDSEIKAQKSPFAMRINERKVFDGKDGFVSINQVMFNVDMGYITDIHFEILEVINEYEFVTARQIFQILQMKGIEIKSQDKVDDKLQRLIKCKLITRYYFTSEEGKGIFRVYCLEKMGKNLLSTLIVLVVGFSLTAIVYLLYNIAFKKQKTKKATTSVDEN